MTKQKEQTAEEITGELGIAENRLLLLSMIADGFDNDAPKVLDKILSLKEQDDKRITSAVVKSMDAGYKLALNLAEQQAKQDILKQVKEIIKKVFSEHNICANESPMAFAEWEVEKDIIIGKIEQSLKEIK